MKQLNFFSVIILMFFLFFGLPSSWAADGTKPMIQNNCLKCHQSFSEMDNILAGNLSSKSMKAHTIQIKITIVSNW